VRDGTDILVSMPTHARAPALLVLMLAAGCATAGGQAAPPGQERVGRVGGGDIVPETVAREVKPHLGVVKACYIQYLNLDPSLHGRVVVHWTISTAGTVSRVIIEENTMGSADVADCIKDVVSHWRFTAPVHGSVDVSFPFVFRPDEQSAPAAGKRDAPAGKGDLDPALVLKEVDAHLDVIKECYEHYLRCDPSLRGKVVAHWTISTAGTVSGVDIEENTMGSADVAACIKEVVLQWRFPAPTGGPVDVSVPFVFESTP
jgi:hypothetical protein